LLGSTDPSLKKSGTVALFLKVKNTFKKLASKTAIDQRNYYVVQAIFIAVLSCLEAMGVAFLIRGVVRLSFVSLHIQPEEIDFKL